MKFLRLIRNYFFYCGIEKEDYNALKKDAYISNFKVWRALHILMAAVFAGLFISSIFSSLMGQNRWLYMILLIYSLVALCGFLFLRKDSLIAQFLIYLSISVLFLFGCFLTSNKPEIPSTTFIVFLLISPMFMIDKPYFMALELSVASAVFLVWMHQVKPYDVWRMDLANVVSFAIVGVFLNILANSIRIKEFVLTRELAVQKDTDELTGLKNKSALTREINGFLTNSPTDKDMMFLLDIDLFKSINDTYGHDVGDLILREMGTFLGDMFQGDEVVGRFGGDEFIIFIKNTDDPDTACRIADEIVKGAAEKVTLPDKSQKVGVSVGLALYNGGEKDYSRIFKKADTAMYKAKADPEKRYCVYK